MDVSAGRKKPAKLIFYTQELTNRRPVKWTVFTFIQCIQRTHIFSVCKYISVFATVLSIELSINACFIHPTCGLFLTCTEGIFFFFYWTHILHTYHNITCNIIDDLNKKSPLTWNGSSLYVVAKPHSCWSLAQSQQPPYKIPPAPTPVLSSPSTRQYKQYYTYRRH